MEAFLKDIDIPHSDAGRVQPEDEKLRNYFENASDLIQFIGPDGSIIYANTQCLNVLGYTHLNLPGLNIADLLRDDQVPQIFTALSRIKNGKKVDLIECVFKTRTGVEIYVEGNMEGHFEKGQFAFTMGIFRDITQRKAMEVTYSLMVKHLPAPIFIIQAGTFRLVNPAFQALTEYSENELIGMKAADITYTEDREKTQKSYERALKSNRPVTSEFRIIRQSGEARWVMTTINTIPYEGDQAILGSIIDLTEHRLIEETLKESQNRYQTLFNSASDAIFIQNMDGRLLEVNDAACKMLGYARNELLKFNITHIESPRFHSSIQDRVSELLAVGFLNTESESITRSGKTIPVELHSRIVEYEKKPAILHVAQDISDRKQAETDQKRYADRLESLVKISEFKTDHLEELLGFALEETVKLTESQMGFINFYDSDSQEFTLSSLFGQILQSKANIIKQSLCRLDSTAILGEAVRQRKPITLNGPQSPGMLKNGYPEGQYQINNYLTVPIFSGQEIVMVVGVANKKLDYSSADSQQIIALMNPVWDIIQRWKAEDALKESEHRYRQLVELSQEGILQMDPKGNIVAANLAACKMFGYPEGGMLGKELSITYLPSERIEAIERLRQIKLNKPMWFERQALRANNTTFLIEVSVSPLTQGYFLETVRDITERKRAEENLRESESRFRELAELLPIMIFEADLQGRLTFKNKVSNVMFGGGAESLQNVNLFDYIALEDKERFLANMQRIVHGEKLQDNEYSALRINGQKFPVLAYSSLIKDINGVTKGMRGTLIDITERKTLEKELHESMRKYQSLVDNLDDFVTETTLSGEFLFVNPAYCKHLGKKQEDILGQPAALFVYPEDAAPALVNLDNLFRPPYSAYSEHREITPLGPRWVAWKAKSVLDNAGHITALTSVGRDITEIKRDKEELEKANQRLLELDKLKDSFLSTVSHELRTPLTSIKSFTEILLNYDEDKATRKEFLGIINEECDRLTRLVNDFLDLSKIQSGKMQWKNQEVSLAEVINSAAQTARPLIDKEKLSLTLNIAPNLPHIMSDKDKMVQVITNILGNSIKFTPKGGNITIKAWWNPENVLPNPNTVNVSVTDTGIGIAPENHHKIFENFGQVGDILKDKPKGTGLGLPICKKILEYFDGKIWVESALGKGSSFIFSLPVTRTVNQAAGAPSTVTSPITASNK